MTTKNYWIRDVEGVYALVDGAAERDQWTKVHGWAESDEPGPTDQVHVVNEHPEVGPGRLPYAAVELLAGLGWKAGPPPELVDITKDPALVDQAVEQRSNPEPAKPEKSSASGSDKK